MGFTTRRVVFYVTCFSILFCCFGILIGHFGISYGSEEDVWDDNGANSARELLFKEVDARRIRENLRILTNQSHPTGTTANEEVADFIFRSFEDSGFGKNVRFAEYDVLLSRPNESDPNLAEVRNKDGTVFIQLKNRETGTGSSKHFESGWFAFSAQGIGQSTRVYYVNQATEDDFIEIERRGINISDSIVLTRSGGGFRGDKVRLAQSYGAKAVLMFLDPELVAPYGTDEELVWPKGMWMPDSAMERGSVYSEEGDPLTPGFVSKVGGRYRRPVASASLPQIPALPIGYGDARRLFELMPDSGVLPSYSTPSPYMNYRLGGILEGEKSLTVKVTNYQERRKIRNVIAVIPGTREPDQYVLLGNHYDAWTFGAIDPNSGTAVLLEIARVMGKLMKQGAWKPKRTIVFGAWDAEEFGLIGSTEWVEDKLQILHARAVAYINCDAAVRGRLTFVAKATPLLNQLIINVTKLVDTPVRNPATSKPFTVYDVWANDSAYNEPQVTKLSASSDYASFVEMAGIPSADVRYAGEYPNAAYHTAFETFEYVEKFIDPDFAYHAVMAKVWMELVRTLADSVVIPFNVREEASDIVWSWDVLKRKLRRDVDYDFVSALPFDLMDGAVQAFNESSHVFESELRGFVENVVTDSEESLRRHLNDRLMHVERMFLEPSGLPGRPLKRHVVQASAREDSYGTAFFPGITDCVGAFKQSKRRGDHERADFWIEELKEHFEKVTQIIERAARFLRTPVAGLF